MSYSQIQKKLNEKKAPREPFVRSKPRNVVFTGFFLGYNEQTNKYAFEIVPEEYKKLAKTFIHADDNASAFKRDIFNDCYIAQGKASKTLNIKDIKRWHNRVCRVAGSVQRFKMDVASGTGTTTTDDGTPEQDMTTEELAFITGPDGKMPIVTEEEEQPSQWRGVALRIWKIDPLPLSKQPQEIQIAMSDTGKENLGKKNANKRKSPQKSGKSSKAKAAVTKKNNNKKKKQEEEQQEEEEEEEEEEQEEEEEEEVEEIEG